MVPKVQYDVINKLCSALTEFVPGQKILMARTWQNHDQEQKNPINILPKLSE